MKKNMIPLLLFFFLVACDSQPKSAFTGSVESKVSAVGTIPQESIFNLTDTFTTQDNKEVSLNQLEGKPTVMAMIFTHCTYACPRLTADVQNIEKKLGKKAEDVNFVLVSFDSERDFPTRLNEFKKEMFLDNNFTLLHGDDDAVRTLSVLLNVQFQKNSDGDFSHSNIISVLDKKGDLVFQKEGINADHTATLEQINDLLK
ncbi:MAG: SCO family protein [Chitinophagaceae bacterium]|nr:SCO family protein [Chitinophagaceae bacterium]